MHFSQHNLPALTIVRKVQTLSAAACDAYYHGYHPGEDLPPATSERVAGILSSLGLWV